MLTSVTRHQLLPLAVSQYNLETNHYNTYRHPSAQARPSFRDNLSVLLEEESRVLDIPPGDASTHPQASLLGAELQAGEGMYPDLQGVYLPSAVTEIEDSYYDEVEMDHSLTQEGKKNSSPSHSSGTHLKPPLPDKPEHLQPNRASADYETISSHGGQTIRPLDTSTNVYDSTSPVHVAPRQNPPPKPPRMEQSFRDSLDYEDLDSCNRGFGVCIPPQLNDVNENIYDDVEGTRQSIASLAEGHYEFMHSASMERAHNLDTDYEDV